MGGRVIKSAHFHRHMLNHSYDRIYLVIFEHEPMEGGT
jgi:hypothetical protein